jgi:hypothetical protein
MKLFFIYRWQNVTITQILVRYEILCQIATASQYYIRILLRKQKKTIILIETWIPAFYMIKLFELDSKIYLAYQIWSYIAAKNLQFDAIFEKQQELL